MKGESNNMKPRIVCALLASASLGLTVAIGPAAAAAEAITYPAPAGEYLVQLEGADAEHNVRDVTFENVTINGAPLAEGQDRLRIGGLVEGVRLKPGRK